MTTICYLWVLGITKESIVAEKKDFHIIGVDPGTNLLGYALIKVDKNEHFLLEALGVVHLQKYQDHYTKLQVIHEKIAFLIKNYRPTQLAIEAPFYGKNPQSMLKLGRAQGAAVVAAKLLGLSVTEYAPRKIKQSITGNGNCSKEQLSVMLQRMMKLETMPKYMDASDALGVAVCHYLQESSPLAAKATGKHKDWKSYLASNPSKIRK